MKPTLLNLMATLFVAAAGGLRADGPVAPAAPTGFGETDGTLPDFIALYDANDDGQLSNEERQALRQDRKRHRKFQARWDTDNNGEISNAEREAAKARIRLMIEQQRRRRFMAVDTDDDGFLSRTEFAAIPAVQNSDANSPGIANTIFDHMDNDPTDDRVSEAEFLAALAAPEQPEPKASDTAPTSP